MLTKRIVLMLHYLSTQKRPVKGQNTGHSVLGCVEGTRISIKIILELLRLNGYVLNSDPKIVYAKLETSEILTTTEAAGCTADVAEIRSESGDSEPEILGPGPERTETVI